MGVFFLLGPEVVDFNLKPFRGELVPKPHTTLDLMTEASRYEAFDLEIGCGAGMHAIAYARANPKRLLVAVERTQDKFAGVEQRLKNHEPLPNLLALRDDAVSLVTHLVSPHSLDRVFLLYPNPYPKESQANKRWHRMPFLRSLHGAMKVGGELTLATNERFYRDEALLWFSGVGLFDLIREDSFVQNDVGSQRLPKARTHFEKKYLAAGQTVYNLVFRAAPVE